MLLAVGRGFRAGLALTVALACQASVAAAGEAVTLGKLPDVVVRSLGTRRDVPLAGALAGKAAVVLVTDGAAGAGCPVGRAAAALQREHGTRFSWAAVGTGPLTADEVQRILDSSPVRVDRLYLDREGRLREALGAPRLPLLLLVDEDGRVRESCSPEGGADGFAAAARALAGVARPSRAEGSGLDEFRLPLVGGSDLVSFLDVAGEEATLVVFLHSRCLACAHEIEVLDFARQRHGGRASFVAVFLDPAPESRIRGFLGAAGAVPDFVLRDPQLRLADRYGVRSAPSLVVLDAAGRVVLSRSGYDERHRDELYAGVMGAFAAAATASAADAVMAEVRRLHDEARAFMREGKYGYALIFQERIRELLPDYHSVHLRIAEAALADGRHQLALESLTRYLAAKPETYDSDAVRQMIAGLGVPAP